MNTKVGILTLTTNYLKQTSTLGNTLLQGRNTEIHKTVQLRYPAAKPIAVPNNLQFVINEIGRFSPQRARNINGPVMVSQTTNKVAPVIQIQSRATFDPRFECFDCNGAVNLNSSMQTTVPSLVSSKGKLMHLNMPGGQWKQQIKFISNDVQKSHYINIFKKEGTIRSFHMLTNRLQGELALITRNKSTSTDNKEPVLSRKDQLKRAVKDYGSTVIIFHVGISLVSLGTCYILVTSGIDMGKMLIPLGLDGAIATSAGEFVTAYAIHKVLAPVRISITLASTPFIVKYLRNIGFLKKPKV